MSPLWGSGGGGGGTVPAEPTVIAAGNLGATYTLDTAGDFDTWLIGTLNANNALTVSNLAEGARVKLLFVQDATGGRTLSVNGTTVSIPNDANAIVGVDLYYDGTDEWIDVAGGASGASGGGYRVLFRSATRLTATAANGNTYLLLQNAFDTQTTSITATVSTIPPYFYLNPTDFAEGENLIVRSLVFCATTLTMNVTVGLYPVSLAGGNASAGTVVANSTATVTNATNNTANNAVSAEFAPPTAGLYGVFATVSANPNATCTVQGAVAVPAV